MLTVTISSLLLWTEPATAGQTDIFRMIWIYRISAVGSRAPEKKKKIDKRIRLLVIVIIHMSFIFLKDHKHIEKRRGCL